MTLDELKEWLRVANSPEQQERDRILADRFSPSPELLEWMVRRPDLVETPKNTQDSKV